jgi:hypothetical protein
MESTAKANAKAPTTIKAIAAPNGDLRIVAIPPFPVSMSRIGAYGSSTAIW